MTEAEHPVVQALRRARMDLTAAQSRITDALNAFDATGFKTPATDPVAAIRREIANGAIRDDIDLTAAINASPLLEPGTVADLRAALAALNEVEVVVRERP